MNSHKFTCLKNTALGFSLVELLIGLTISLFVGAIAVGYLVSSSRSLTNQNSTDLIQENSRFAFEILSSEARLAGVNLSTVPEGLNSTDVLLVEGISTASICAATGDTAPAASDTEACNVDNLGYTIGAKKYNSDRVAFDYATNIGTTCTNVDITTLLIDPNQPVSIVSVYWIADLDDDEIPSLYCQSYSSILSQNTNPSYSNYSPVGNATPLVDGIDSLQVQFGFDSDNDANNNIDAFTALGNVPAGNMDDIRAIKVGLLVNSGQVIDSEINTEGKKIRTYRVLDSAYTTSATDGSLRQSVSTTIFFPNLPPKRF